MKNNVMQAVRLVLMVLASAGIINSMAYVALGISLLVSLAGSGVVCS